MGSTFHYSNLRGTSLSSFKTCDNVSFSVVVTNTGNVDSDEVVQAYVQWKNAPSAPQRTLVGFERVNVPAGESMNVSFVVQPYQLAVVEEANSVDELPTWMVVPV